jgi:hypothetical protein
VTDQLVFDLRAGREAVERGIASVEATHADFVPRMREAAKVYVERHGSVTADDAHRNPVWVWEGATTAPRRENLSGRSRTVGETAPEDAA